MPLDTLPVNVPQRLEYDGVGLVVVRTPSGVRALDDTCPHARYRLSDGEVLDDEIECPGHGWRFHLASGGCSTVPKYAVRTYKAWIAGGSAWVALVEEPQPVAQGR